MSASYTRNFPLVYRILQQFGRILSFICLGLGAIVLLVKLFPNELYAYTGISVPLAITHVSYWAVVLLFIFGVFCIFLYRSLANAIEWAPILAHLLISQILIYTLLLLWLLYLGALQTDVRAIDEFQQWLAPLRFDSSYSLIMSRSIIITVAILLLLLVSYYKLGDITEIQNFYRTEHVHNTSPKSLCHKDPTCRTELKDGKCPRCEPLTIDVSLWDITDPNHHQEYKLSFTQVQRRIEIRRLDPRETRRGNTLYLDTEINPRYGKISAPHATIEGKIEDGTFTLTDERSRNKTRIENTVLTPQKPSPLRDGDTIHLGDVSFMFKVSSVGQSPGSKA